MNFLSRVFNSRATQAKARALHEDHAYCSESLTLVETCFADLMRSEGYSLSFIGRCGSYRSECLFGLTASSKPRLIVGGETGPSVWIGSPTSEFENLHVDAGSDWFNLAPVTDFIWDRGPRWLAEAEEWGNFEKGYLDLASRIRTLWPQLTTMFESKGAIESWETAFEAFASKACDDWDAEIQASYNDRAPNPAAPVPKEGSPYPSGSVLDHHYQRFASTFKSRNGGT